MLKGIHPLLRPDVLGWLAEMGHGDTIAIVDRNFPASSTGQRVAVMPGVDVGTIARAILTVFPVDTFVDPPAFHMQPVTGATAGPAYPEMVEVLAAAEGRSVAIGPLERFEFYRQAREAYCVVATGDTRPYACFLLVKGVITD